MANGRHVNVSNFKLVKGNNTKTLLYLQSVSLAAGGRGVTASGDGDHFPTLNRRVFSDPKVTAQAQDINGIRSLDGATGALSWILEDAVNGATNGGGCLLYSIANANNIETTQQGQHLQVSSGEATFATESTDGVTSPIVITAP